MAVQLYTVYKYTQTAKELEETFKKIKDIGYNAVQVSGIGPIDYKEVKKIADDNGVKICITHMPFQRFTGDLCNLINQHKYWGCDYIGIGAMPEEYRVSYEKRLEFINIIKPIAKEITENGLKFVYHNHWFEFERYNSKNFFEMLEQNTDPKEIGFLVDTAWIQIGGASPQAFIEKYSNRIEVMHLKDIQIIENKFTTAEVGEGNIDFKPIINICEKIGVNWYAIEQDWCYRDPFECLKISLENIKKW
jgi:sugar phosphate isomerase/epimerase